MKVAIFCESPADQRALQILIESILGHSVEVVSRKARPGGVGSVLKLVPAVCRELFYGYTADTLAVVVDSDDSVVHILDHEASGADDQGCRLCQLQRIVAQLENELQSKLPERPRMRTALGLAVPAIEAWYRCGQDPHVNESAWSRAMNEGQYPYDRNSLKRDVYGTDRPSVARSIARAEVAARQLATKLDDLETLFPCGFGAFARDIRSWRGNQ